MVSVLFNALSRFFITFLPRNKHLLISWLQSPSAEILEPKKIKSVPGALGAALILGGLETAGGALQLPFPSL